MALDGRALLAFWNDCMPDRTDYHEWHTREHVPERLTLPGFIAARRYLKSHGSLPSFFTLYSVESLDTLQSREYRSLLNNPTAWTNSMRRSLTHLLRLPCEILFTSGTGIGGWACVGLAQQRTMDADVFAACNELRRDPAITAVHYGAVDPASPGLPFSVDSAGARHDFQSSRGVLVFEGYDEEMLDRSAANAITGLSKLISPSSWTKYQMVYCL